MPTCSLSPCSKKVHAKELCHSHWRKQWEPTRDASKHPCSVQDCSRVHWGKGFCKKHYLASYNAANREKTREYRKGPRAKVWAANKNRRDREAAIVAYGGACVCCGQTERIYLQLDHVENDGKEDREMNGYGSRFYSSLKRRGYPPLIQILCANCHNAKTHYSGCGDLHSKPKQ